MLAKPKGKILLVDDDPLNIEVLDEILQDEYDIFFSTNGTDALEIARVESPDLILLDVMMPEMDGHEVCRRLKAESRTNTIPVIFVTAMGEVEDETMGLEIGAVDYMVKPVSPPIVKARVHNHMELKRYQDMLENLAMVDGLTGIANRRNFDETLDREWRRGRRDRTPLSIIFVDIDFFKQFNDTYGHTEGDECLKRVADALEAAVFRSADLVARYGGEEFAFILPNTNSRGASLKAVKIRKLIHALDIRHIHSKVSDHITISLGVASTVPDDEMMPEVLLKAADEALYEAKNAGRNCIQLSKHFREQGAVPAKK